MALILKHQTVEAFMARFRAAYANSDRERCVQLGRWALGAVQAGDVTDAQCRAAFGLSVAQWNSLKGRMQARVNALQTLQSAVGE